MNYSKSCNFCGAPNLAWVNVLGKWKLEDKSGNLHRCIVSKPKEKKKEKIDNFRPDPLIEKALHKFKNELRGNGKIYVLKNRKFRGNS